MKTTTTGVGTGIVSAPSVLRRSSPRTGERVIVAGLFGAAILSVVITTAIFLALMAEGLQFFRQIPLTDFLLGKKWFPLFEPPDYGILPIVKGTFVIALIAAVVFVPFGLLAAIYLSQYASPRSRDWMKPAIEILAGIPTVVYGFFAIKTLTPLIREYWPGFLGSPPETFNALSAGIVIGIMIIPTVASVAEDAISAVPDTLRQGALALGSNKSTAAKRVVFPAAISGVVASIVLGFARVIGETMIVLMAAGGQQPLAWGSFTVKEPTATMTSYIGYASLGDQPVDSIGYKSLYAVGIVLFLVTMSFNIISIRFVRRFRKEYE